MNSNTNISFKSITSKSAAVQARYFKKILLAASPNSYLFWNGAESMEWAIYMLQTAASYDSAVSEMAAHEGDIPEEDIRANYDNWYYIMPLAEVIEALDYDIRNRE